MVAKYKFRQLQNLQLQIPRSPILHSLIKILPKCTVAIVGKKLMLILVFAGIVEKK